MDDERSEKERIEDYLNEVIASAKRRKARNEPDTMRSEMNGKVVEYPADSDVRSLFATKKLIYDLIKDVGDKLDAACEQYEDSYEDDFVEFWIREDLCSLIDKLDKEIKMVIKREGLELRVLN